MLIDENDMVSVTELGKSLNKRVGEAAEGRRIIVMNNHIPTAALIGMDDMRRLDALQDELAAAAEEAAAGDESDISVSVDELWKTPPPAGTTVAGINAAGDPVYLDLAQHYLLLGDSREALAKMRSAMVWGANPAASTTFVLATPEAGVRLYHTRTADFPFPVAMLFETDLEAGDSVFKLQGNLESELRARRALLRRHRVSSIAEYRAQTSDPYPDLVVILEYADVLLASESLRSTLERYLQRGDELGIYLWLTSRSLPPHLASEFQHRLATRIVDRGRAREALCGPTGAATLPEGGAYYRNPFKAHDLTRFTLSRADEPSALLGSADSSIGSWGSPLTRPITLGSLDPQAVSAGTPLRLTVGITESDSGLVPFTVGTEDPVSLNIKIFGETGSGRSTAVKTLITSAAVTHPGRCAFYIIDDKGTLSDMAEMPNVGGYTLDGKDDELERYLGEFEFITDLRRREMRQRSATTIDEYFQSRAEVPVPEDPYERLFLVLDTPVWKDGVAREKLIGLLKEGPRRGVHVIAVARNDIDLPVKAQDTFGSKIVLNVADPSAVFHCSPESKRLLKEVKAFDQPGRGVDISSNAHMRIALPQLTGTVQDPTDPVLVVGEVMRLHPNVVRAPRLSAVSSMISEKDLWDVYSPVAAAARQEADPARRPVLDVRIPLGLSVETERGVALHQAPWPHLLIAGDSQSGKKTTLRTLIKGILRQYTPEEAQIVLLDNNFEMLDDKDHLADSGHLLAYSDTRHASVREAVQKVTTLVAPRLPEGDSITSDHLRTRSWYQGPEVFVFINNVPSFCPNVGSYAESALDGLIEIVSLRYDLGLNIIGTTPAQGFAVALWSNKLYKELRNSNCSYLLHSGPASEGTLWTSTGIKFCSRRAGRAMLVDGASWQTEIVQVAYTPPPTR
ncbi:FtsK/SpoIIIE domain-containing protein [Mycobacteroides abscessus]|uniref:FtsK/SpoIIIE domain-containing protein n=1 Tax=Mycobacteroides abscessus TaxID=36809 RepID=UPI0012FFE743|nr:FtsK/SpoIIIE domain-containing protein [Mycobacteroides abscessus]